jgi:RNA polymerase sigma-54 factor
MLGQRQTLSLQQKLSPQQIQLMKLLQLPTMAIEQRIQEELEINPVLEAGDDFEDQFSAEGEITAETGEDDPSEDADTDFKEVEEVPLREDDYELDEYLSKYAEDDPNEYIPKGEGRNADEEDKTVPVAVENSFHEYLEQQLGMINLKSEREVLIAKQIIGSIDDDGYLRHELFSIADDLMFSQNIMTDEHEIGLILEKIHRFDPPGIGARTLQECLLIQIKLKLEAPNLDDNTIKNLRLAARLIFELFDEFTKKHYTKMQRHLNLTEDQLKEAMTEILKPKAVEWSREHRRAQYAIHCSRFCG